MFSLDPQILPKKNYLKLIIVFMTSERAGHPSGDLEKMESYTAQKAVRKNEILGSERYRKSNSR